MHSNYVTAPIDVAEIGSKESPFGEGNRYHIMIYRCVTDPDGNSWPKRKNQDGSLSIGMSVDDMRKLRDSINNLLK